MSERIHELETQILALKTELAELRRQEQRKTVKDYILTDWHGRPVHLSELFGERRDLIVVHNMGKGCTYCTLWADEYNGVLPHLLDRAAFAVVSPDPPAAQKIFAASRGWTFRMVSGQGSPFTGDMGYLSERGQNLPGVTTFHREEDGSITRVATAPFGPGDDFCGVWHFLDLLADGADGWSPKYKY